MKVCAEPGCPVLCETSRCVDHTRQRDKRRGTRQERGYDATHEAYKAEQTPKAYGQRCHLCGERMWPHQALVPDHTEDRTGYRGIAHASCNNRDGATRGNALRGGG